MTTVLDCMAPDPAARLTSEALPSGARSTSWEPSYSILKLENHFPTIVWSSEVVNTATSNIMSSVHFSVYTCTRASLHPFVFINSENMSNQESFSHRLHGKKTFAPLSGIKRKPHESKVISKQESQESKAATEKDYHSPFMA